jgi:hypothetical protein
MKTRYNKIEIEVIDEQQAIDILAYVDSLPNHSRTVKHSVRPLIEVVDYIKSGCGLTLNQDIFYCGGKYKVLHQLDSIVRIGNPNVEPLAVDLRHHKMYVFDTSK